MEASNGASDYGNKFGEPVISGFARTFGMKNLGGERREWIKPIMFSGGMGSMDSSMTKKLTPEKGFYLCNNTLVFKFLCVLCINQKHYFMIFLSVRGN